MRWGGCALVAVLCLLACSSPEQRFAEHREEARSYARGGKLPEAILELRSALKLRPQSAEVCADLAVLYWRSGQLQQSYFFWTEAFRLDPTDLRAKLWAASLVMGDDPAEGRRLVEEVLEEDPGNVDGWARLADVHLVEGNSDEALKAALTARELGPDKVTSHKVLATVYQAKFREQRLTEETADYGLLEQALEELDRADALIQERASRGEAAQDLMPPETGLEVRLDVARVLGLIPERRGEVSDAYRRALESARNETEKLRVAQAAFAYGARAAPEVARMALEEVISVLPQNVSAWLQLASLAPEEPPGGEQAVLDRMLETIPTNGEAHRQYALFLARNGKLDEALAHLATAEANPEVRPRQGLALTRGELLLRTKRDLDGGRAVASQMRREFPEAWETAVMSALIARWEGRHDDSIQVLEEAVARDPDAIEARRLLSDLLYRRGRLEQAASEVEAVLEARPLDADMLRHRAAIKLDQGQPAAALVSLQRLAQLRPLRRSELGMVVQALYDQGVDERARAVLERILKGGKPVPLLAVLFAEHEGQRDPARARALLEEALPVRGKLRTRIAEMLTRMDLREGKPEVALERINGLLAQGVRAPEIAVLRPRVLLAMGRVPQAERDLLQLVEAYPGLTEPFDLLVRIYASQGRAQEAITSFEEAAQAGILAPETLVLLARLHLVVGNRSAAREVYERALAERSDLPLAKNDVAYLLAEEDQDLDRALTLAEEARTALPALSSTADTLGYVYLKRGLPGPAAEQFRQALSSSSPEDRQTAIFHHHLGLALRELGRAEEARREFELALEKDPELGDARVALQELAASG